MDYKSILEIVKEYIPVPVIVAVFAVIFLSWATLFIMDKIEKSLEEKKGIEISFFDHKKIWLNIFWSLVMVTALAVAKYIKWKELFYYLFILIGASTFIYEVFLKKKLENKASVN